MAEVPEIETVAQNVKGEEVLISQDCRVLKM